MKVYTLCVDPERGRYVAFFAEDPIIRADSYSNTDEAVGILLRTHPGITVEEVVCLDEPWK